MEATLIAPCGVNCGVCKAHLRKNRQCPGCRNNRTVHIACVIYSCKELKASASGFCYECAKFPCRKIKHLDERHRRKVGISNIENLGIIKEKGVAYLLEKEEKKFKCPECGGVICNNGICLNCGLDKL